MAIVHPDGQIDLTKAHSSDTIVLAYLSVGEIAADAPYRDQTDSALLTGSLANRALYRLEYETFTAQPIYP